MLVSKLNTGNPGTPRPSALTDTRRTDKQQEPDDLILKMLNQKLGGLATVNKELRLEFGKNITLDQAKKALGRLYRLQKRIPIYLRFLIGDAYNALPCDYGKREEWVEETFKTAGSLIRSWASVAANWKGPRDGNLPWAFYQVCARLKTPAKTEGFLKAPPLPDQQRQLAYYDEWKERSQKASLKATDEEGKPITPLTVKEIKEREGFTKRTNSWVLLKKTSEEILGADTTIASCLQEIMEQMGGEEFQQWVYDKYEEVQHLNEEAEVQSDWDAGTEN